MFSIDFKINPFNKEPESFFSKVKSDLEKISDKVVNIFSKKEKPKSYFDRARDDVISPMFIGSFGTLTGVALGATANLISNNGSIFASGNFESCKNTPFLGISQLQAVNNFRESMPLIGLLEQFSALISIGNAYYHRNEDEAGLSGFLKVYWKRHYKPSVFYSVRSWTTLMISMAVRELLYFKAWSFGIDISGHAMHQAIYTFKAIQNLNRSEKMNNSWQKTALKTVAVVIGLTDAVWMYNTTANCHSIADVAVGIGIAFAGDNITSGIGWVVTKTGEGIYKAGSSAVGFLRPKK